MRSRGVLAILIVGWAAGACKTAPVPTVQADAGVASGGGLTAEEAAQVLARVGEHTITLGDYVAALEHTSHFDRIRYRAPERRKELLREMVDVMLLADEARERGYDKDPITEQEVREIIRDAYFEKAREAAPTPAEIPDQEVRAYYEAHTADFHDPERRRVSAVVLPAQAAADAVLAVARGSTAAQWGDLVRAKSIDPQARASLPVDLMGDFGFVSPPGDTRGTNARIPEEVRAALFEATTVGEVVGHVVKSATRFYVVRFAAKSDAHERSLADADRTIRVKLSQDALRAKEQAMVDELRKRYPVQIDEAALAQVKVDVSADASVK